MEMRVILALVCGAMLGAVFVYHCFRHGLTDQEWEYFKSFLEALRCGEYDELPPDNERSGKNE